MRSAELTSTPGTGLYGWYIAAGFLYVVVKIVFVLSGYLHTGAIFHGLIPAVLTVAAGFLSFRRSRRFSGSAWYAVSVVLPVLSFVITPVYMYLKESEMWLKNGRLEVLVIYEVLAVAQFLLAIRYIRHRRKTNAVQQ